MKTQLTLLAALLCCGTVAAFQTVLVPSGSVHHIPPGELGEQKIYKSASANEDVSVFCLNDASYIPGSASNIVSYRECSPSCQCSSGLLSFNLNGVAEQSHAKMGKFVVCSLQQNSVDVYCRVESVPRNGAARP